MLLSDIFGIVDASIIRKINLIYPLISDGTMLYKETDTQMIGLLKEFKQKFEVKFAGI